MSPRWRGQPVPWWRARWQEVGCTRCGAPPGEPCRTDTGRTKYEPHAERARLVAETARRLLGGEWPVADDTGPE